MINVPAHGEYKAVITAAAQLLPRASKIPARLTTSLAMLMLMALPVTLPPLAAAAVSVAGAAAPCVSVRANWLIAKA